MVISLHPHDDLPVTLTTMRSASQRAPGVDEATAVLSRLMQARQALAFENLIIS
jgi:hypothetical protein